MADELDESIEELVTRLEGDLEIAPGFLTNLVTEDDWSFVIKGHAFLEAAIAHLLAHSLEEPKLQAVFANLETSGSRSGKIAFIKELELLDDEARRFIRSFSELRNALVHDIRQVGFRFDAHLSTLDTQQRSNFAASFGYFAAGSTFKHGDDEIATRDFVVANPKTSAWYSVMALCSIIYATKGTTRIKKAVRALEQKLNAGAKVRDRESSQGGD